MSTLNQYKPKKLKQWQAASNYAGQHFEEYYMCGGQTRDSDLMERVNFAAILDRLGGESETVIVARASHWACGWVETILIHQSDAAKLVEGDKIKAELEDYPLLDEDSFYELENEELEQTAKDNMSEFTEEIQKFLELNTDVPSDLIKTLDLSGLVFELVRDDHSYNGEGGWVTQESIKRFAKTYEGKEIFEGVLS